MEVLQRAINEGIQFEVNGDRLKIKSTKPIPPDLVEQLRVHKQEIIRTLKEQGEADSYSECEQDKGQARRWCTGYEPPRYVYPEVCAWHISEGDVNCGNCRYLSRKDKEVLMDSYLNKTIAKLNSRGAVYYEPGDSQAKRNQIYDLEKRITEAFLVCDVKAFVKAVDSWRKIFFK